MTQKSSFLREDNTMPFKWLRCLLSASAIIVALLHLAFPDLAIDAITLICIVMAILPWLTHLIKSLELPSGWRIEFHELQRAASRAEVVGLLSDAPPKDEQTYSFQSIAKQDPNLSLAGLRIEIERRLVQLADASQSKPSRPMGIGQLLRNLAQSNVLTREQQSILADMVNLLNSAVHGASVDSGSANWAIDVGPRLLASLDERIEEAKQAKIKGGANHVSR